MSESNRPYSTHADGHYQDPVFGRIWIKDITGMSATKKDLKGRYCPKLYTWLEVDMHGRAWMCCPSWLPYSIGNVHNHLQIRSMFNWLCNFLVVNGIDFGHAIENHSGDIEFMMSLTADFIDIYGDSGNQIGAMLAIGEVETAQRLAHNLAGISGSFGANALMVATRKPARNTRTTRTITTLSIRFWTTSSIFFSTLSG